MAKYIWYSGATDITGKALAEALNLTGTKTRPRNLRRNDILIGWGTKINEDVNLPCNVLNHPNYIRHNRNKLRSLEIMAEDQDLVSNISKFCTANNVENLIQRQEMKFPLVGRTNFHQGGKGFWLCLNKGHVNAAIMDGAQYFQEYINIVDEYRLHVVFGKVIYAVKKVEHPSEDSWIKQRKEKIHDYAQKNNVELNEDTLDYALRRLFKEVVLPDRIVRSNRRGWKFSSVRLNAVSQPLKNAAIKSVETLSLDFGAVDCAVSEEGTPYIIEVNSGPGLQGTSLEKYITAFNTKIDELENPEPVRQAPRPARRVRAAAVGAERAEENELRGDGFQGVGLVRVMQNVQNDEEARAVIAAIVREQNRNG